MFVLFTDFTLHGPYVGQLKAALHAHAPGVPVIDLMHDAPALDPRSSAFLLEPICRSLPPGCVVIGVVDPGVGTTRPACVIEADGRWFVGPDNGLFEFVARRGRDVRYRRLPPAGEDASPSFHGRDVFAPAAAAVLRGELPGDEAEAAERRYRVDWGDDTPQVLYVDGYGNAITGIRGDVVSDQAIVQAGETELTRAETFGHMSRGAGFWYRNSSGLVEIAVNGGRADRILGLEVGMMVRLLRP
ncbi:MAG: SAM-dependent chlorinase/fluorinase [Aquisalimonadaceae bacterium]